MSDFLLAMIFKGHQQSRSFVKTDMATNLNTRLDDLSACGLTNLEAGEAELAAGLRTRSEGLANKAMAKHRELTKKRTKN